MTEKRITFGSIDAATREMAWLLSTYINHHDFLMREANAFMGMFEHHHGDKDRACLLRVQGKIQQSIAVLNSCNENSLQLDEALLKLKDLNVSANGIIQSETNFTLRRQDLLSKQLIDEQKKRAEFEKDMKEGKAAIDARYNEASRDLQENFTIWKEYLYNPSPVAPSKPPAAAQTK